jgi:hypothetical protein
MTPGSRAIVEDMEIIETDSLPCGLTNAEARRRLIEFGTNATPDTETHPVRLVLGKFVAPAPCLLEAIVLQLVLGEDAEASIIACTGPRPGESRNLQLGQDGLGPRFGDTHRPVISNPF